MIDGMRILYSTPMIEKVEWMGNLCYILMSITIVFGVTSLIFDFFKKTGTSNIFDGLTLISVTVFLISIGVYSLVTYESDRYKYKVIIDKPINLVEFDRLYEIIDKEGEIYTIIKKEVE